MEVTFQTAKDGTKVPMLDGRSLESLGFPRRDAHRWVKREEDHIKPFSLVLIMGAGSGVYIEELAKCYTEKTFIVFECMDLIAEKLPTLPANVQLVVVDSINELMETDSINILAQQPFKILRHPGAYRYCHNFYQDLTHFLTGRSKVGFNWNLRHRPAQARYFRHCDKASAGEMFSGRPISVVDINRFTSQYTKDPCYEHSIWKTLKELVK